MQEEKKSTSLQNKYWLSATSWLRRRHRIILFVLLLYAIFPGLLFWLATKGAAELSDASLTSFCTVCATVCGVFLALSVAVYFYFWQSYNQRIMESANELRERAAHLREIMIGNEQLLGDTYRKIDSLCEKLELVSVAQEFIFQTEIWEELPKLLHDLANGIKVGELDDSNRVHFLTLIRVSLSGMLVLRRLHTEIEFAMRVPEIMYAIVGFAVALFSSVYALLFANLPSSPLGLPDYWNFACASLIIYLTLLPVLSIMRQLRHVYPHFPMRRM